MCEVGRQVVRELFEVGAFSIVSRTGGCTSEMLRVCLDDHEALLLPSAVEDFARHRSPESIFNCFTMATMTALQKPEGGIRGIAVSTSFHRLVAKTMAKQFMTDVEHHDPEMTVLSIDGIAAYDHVYRSSIPKLHEIPSLRSMLPFDRKTYARASTYWWSDEDGVSHGIGQYEGEEQGDFLMPLLFSLATMRWQKSKNSLFDGEFPFLDDVYVMARGCSTSANSTSGNSTSRQLAEVEIGRSRTDGVCSVSSCFSFFFSCFCLPFTFSFSSSSYSSDSSFCFCSVSVFCPQKLEPCTLKPSAAFRWTRLRSPPLDLPSSSAGPPPSAGPTLRWTPPPLDRPKFRPFLPSPAPIFALSLSLGVFSWNFGGV